MVDILHKVGITAEPARVVAALTTVDGIRSWWSSDATGAATKGGEFTFRGGAMRVIDAASETVRWQYFGPAQDWVGTEVTFRLKQAEDQTFVFFTHSGWREPVEFMHHCSTKWATYLLSLKALLETGEGRPAPRDVKIEKNG